MRLSKRPFSAQQWGRGISHSNDHWSRVVCPALLATPHQAAFDGSPFDCPLLCGETKEKHGANLNGENNNGLWGSFRLRQACIQIHSTV